MTDLYLGILLPPNIAPVFGCPGGDGVIFLAEGYRKTQITCLSAPPQSFEPLIQNLTLPAASPATVMPNLLSFIWPADFSAGTYTFFTVFTHSAALADGRIDPRDVMMMDAQAASFGL